MNNENAAMEGHLSAHSLDTDLDLIDPLKRVQMVAIAAYFRAKKRGFAPNGELADWFDAEHEIDRHLNSFSS